MENVIAIVAVSITEMQRQPATMIATVQCSFKDNFSKTGSTLDVHYNALTADAVISYTLQNAQSVKMAIFNQQGRNKHIKKWSVQLFQFLKYSIQ
jgi:hypothetical protein